MEQRALENLPRPDSTMGAFLRQAAERFGEAPFLIDGTGRTLNRVELDREASRCANALLAQGLGRGATVGVFSPNTLELVIAGFGILRSGATLTPFNSSYKRRELLHQIRDSGASLVLVDKELLPTIEECVGGVPVAARPVAARPVAARPGAPLPGCEIRVLEPAFWQGASAEDPDVDVDRGRDVAYLPYSSGTVGLSKGIELGHPQLIAGIRQFLYTFDDLFDSDSDATYCCLPLYHIYGFSLILNGTLASGGRLHLRQRFIPDDCLDTIERERITNLPAVPPIVLALLARPDLAGRDLSSLRWLSVGAAPVPVPAIHRFRELTGVPVLQGYGMTETAGIASLNSLECDWDPAESAGPPVQGIEFKIVEARTGGRELGVGEVGELAIRGPSVMMGYRGAPEENRRAFRDGWFYSGDIARVDELGRLHLVDRKREMIKYKGFQVTPAELEAVILELAEVADCAVIGKKDPLAGEIPKAFVALKAGATLDEQQIRDHVTSQVAGYKQIRELEFVDAVPRSAAGKILRRVLVEREAASASS